MPSSRADRILLSTKTLRPLFASGSSTTRLQISGTWNLIIHYKHITNLRHQSLRLRVYHFSMNFLPMLTPLRGPPVLVELAVPFGPAAVPLEVHSNKSRFIVSMVSHWDQETHTTLRGAGVACSTAVFRCRCDSYTLLAFDI
jgi:hypothetical protein